MNTTTLAHNGTLTLNEGYFARRTWGDWLFALLAVVGAVLLHPQSCAQLDAAQLAGLASEAKRQAKAVPGYSLHILDTLSLSA